MGPIRLLFSRRPSLCALLMAPSVYHRLHWRRDVIDKRRDDADLERLGDLWRRAARLGHERRGVFDAERALDRRGGSCGDHALMLGVFTWLWFGLPMTRRARDRGRVEAYCGISGARTSDALQLQHAYILPSERARSCARQSAVNSIGLSRAAGVGHVGTGGVRAWNTRCQGSIVDIRFSRRRMPAAHSRGELRRSSWS